MTNQLPSTMQAIVQTVYGGPDVLHFDEVPLPELRPRDLLIQVKAASVNPVDTKRRRGGPAGEAVPEGYKILGWDAAGVVVAIGAEASLFAVGDEVWCAGDIGRNGSYAEYVAVDERIVGRKPRTLSFVEAAAVPLTALTAWEGLLEMIQADRGDAGTGGRVCLVVGGAGGAGSMGIQIARQVCNLRVVATASRPQSAAYCRRLGAEAVIDHLGPLRDQLQAAGYAGADYIYNTAPLSNFPQLAAALNPLREDLQHFGSARGQSDQHQPALWDSRYVGLRVDVYAARCWVRDGEAGADPASGGRIAGRRHAADDAHPGALLAGGG